MSLLDVIKKSLYYYDLFGFEGLRFGISKRLLKNNILSINPKVIKYPVYLRNDTSDLTIFYQIFQKNEYQITFNEAPKTIIDCGANIGLASVYFKNKFPNSKIIAIEPEKSNFELLLKNTEKYPDIHCINCGIWHKTCSLEMQPNTHEKCGFIFTETNGNSQNTVQALSLPEIMEKFKLQQIDLLKIDIEGSEKELFENNSSAWLSKCNCIIIELHDHIKPGCTKTFFNKLNDYDYRSVINGENIVCFLNKIGSYEF